MFKTAPAKQLLITTTMTLTRPYEELGLVWNTGGKLSYEQALDSLQRDTLKRYPDADAVIALILDTRGMGFGLWGTAVRYTTERTETWTPSPLAT